MLRVLSSLVSSPPAPFADAALKRYFRSGENLTYGCRKNVTNGGCVDLTIEEPAFSPAGHVQVFGPLRVVTSTGQDCTPSGAYRQALLAVLLLARNGERSRTALQYLLWPNKDHERGLLSLRNALSVLKRELQPLGPGILTADAHRVRLSLNRLSVDALELRQNPGAGRQIRSELLEGLSLGRRDADEFDDWLRTERSYWAEQVETSALLATSAPPMEASVQIAPIPQAASMEPLVVKFIGAPVSIMKTIAGHLANQGPVMAILPGDMSPSAEHATVKVSSWENGAIRAIMVTARAQDGRTVIQEIAEIPRAAPTEPEATPALLDLTFGVADTLSLERAKLIQGNPDLTRSVLEILAAAASQEPGGLDLAHKVLAERTLQDGDPVWEVLRAYLATFSVGENPSDGEPSDDQVRDAMRASEAIQNSVTPALARTLAGYSLDFLAADTERAEALMRDALKADENSALAWDHMAMMLFRRGQYASALQAAKKAVVLGRKSPFLASYETSVCLAASIAGDHRQAAHFGSRAVARGSGFQDARVYQLSSLGYLGDATATAKLRDALEKADPDITIERIAARAEVRLAPDGHARLITGLRKAGLKDH